MGRGLVVKTVTSPATLVLGDVVRVRVLSGATAERVVCGFSVYTGAPLFSTHEEAQHAAEDGRPARGIGWPEDHVLGVIGGQP